MRGWHSKNLEPAQPGIMQQRKVLPVMGDKNPTVLCRRQEMCIISGALKSQVACCDGCMTGLAENERHLQSHIMIGIEACHNASRCVRGNASINKVFVPVIIPNGRFYGFLRQNIVMRNPCDITIDNVQMRDECPHGDPISLHAGFIRSGIMRVGLNVAR